jgi:hypothetical protein
MNYKHSFLGISLAPRRNRRCVVFFWWLMVFAGFESLSLIFQTHPRWLHSVVAWWALLLAFLLANSLGSFVWVAQPNPDKFAAGIRTLFDPSFRDEQRKNPAPDEREQLGWALASRRAYGFLVVAAMFLLCLYYTGWGPKPGVFRDALVIFAFWIVFNLPVAIYLWTEPDMENQN